MTIDQATGSLSVGQLAARAGVRADTIRYYERAGLLPEPNRTDGDHRRYGAADLDRLLFIRGAQRLGLRLAEIRELVALRANLTGMLAGIPGPGCPEPVPGTWCPPDLEALQEGGDRDVLVLR